MSSSNLNRASADSACAARRVDIEDGGLLVFDRAFTEQSRALFDELMNATLWEQHRLRLFGREVLAPRLSAWHADAGCDYRYSGLQLKALPLNATLLRIRDRIATLSGTTFNSVLLNLYRDGNDAMGWHSDDERELGKAPRIASLSLGATRRFLLRHRGDPRRRLQMDLADGSLLLMEPPLQRYWRHAVPRTKLAVGPRINLTWRCIVATQAMRDAS